MDNVTILKYLLLLIAAPIWWPFLRTLWEDLKKALREEGGLWGDAPFPRELEEIRRQKAREELEVIHEPHADARRKRGFGRRPGARRRGSAGAPLKLSGGGPMKGTGAPRRGFR